MTQFVGLRAVHGSSSRVRVPSSILLSAPASPAAAAVASGGSFAAASYFWKIVATNGTGVSKPSSEVTATIVLNGSATLTWAAVTGATGYRIYRGTSTGAEDHYQTSATNSFTDTGAAGTSGALPTSATGYFASISQLSTKADTIVDLDLASVRKALAHHSAIEGYYVSAANTNAHSGTNGALTSLPSNA